MTLDRFSSRRPSSGRSSSLVRSLLFSSSGLFGRSSQDFSSSRSGTMSTGGTPPISSSAGSVNASDSSGSADPENEIIDDKAPLWKFVKKIDKMAGAGSWRWRCNFCKMHYNGSYTRVRGHLLKEGTAGIAVCNKVTPHAFTQMSKLVRECKERLMNAAQTSSSTIIRTARGEFWHK